MKIALDYDETYTADPNLWTGFIAMAKALGHEVFFVTYRYEPDEGTSYNDDIKKSAEVNEIEIVYTHGQQKAGVVYADIWIDDTPLTIPVASDLRDMHKGCQVNGDDLPNKYDIKLDYGGIFS